MEPFCQYASWISFSNYNLSEKILEHERVYKNLQLEILVC